MCKGFLELVHASTACVTDALGVAKSNVVFLCTVVSNEIPAGNTSGAGSIDDNLDVGDVFADDVQGVD